MTSFVDKPRFSNAQNAARVFILSYKHIGMVSLSYFEDQILTLESLESHTLQFLSFSSLKTTPIRHTHTTHEQITEPRYCAHAQRV